MAANLLIDRLNDKYSQGEFHVAKSLETAPEHSDVEAYGQGQRTWRRKIQRKEAEYSRRAIS
jgi:hypothetical protein